MTKNLTTLLICALSFIFLGDAAAQATTRNVPSVTYPTIQSAVDASVPGDTVSVGPGTYNEQVKVTTSNLTITGSGDSTLIQPTTVVANSTSLSTGAAIAAIVLVDGASDVTIEQLAVDGSLAGSSLGCAPAFMGIFYRAASGVVSDTRVTNIFTPASPACQGVIGIFVQSGNGGPKLNASVVVDGNRVENYGKNGVTGNNPGTFVTVTNNFIAGRGPVGAGDAAQNGVQLAFGAHGKVTSNVISGNDYTPDDFSGCGFLAFKAGGTIGQTRSNTFSGNEQNVCNTAGGPSKFSPFN